MYTCGTILIMVILSTQRMNVFPTPRSTKTERKQQQQKQFFIYFI